MTFQHCMNHSRQSPYSVTSNITPVGILIHATVQSPVEES